MDAKVDREIGRLGKPRFLVLGIDPGIKSCGFALLDLNNHEILEMGVRLFDSPTHSKLSRALRLFVGGTDRLVAILIARKIVSSTA